MRIERVKALFQDALDLPARRDWVTWLRAQTGSDYQLFEEVSSLIRARAAMQQAAPIAPAPAASVPPNCFGAYRAVGLLGRGGTSTVYRAERADGQYRQTVALKVMAGYLTGPEFLRRFETERQLLASLNHPNITHLLDGGVAETGEPFLVMEYVEGERLDDYCDRLKLSVPRRLALFVKVCEAVEYAHRNLIVHGDLKPNNILATADGGIKLLDFGTGVLLDAAREFTVTRTRMLTPRYASPERLRGGRVTPAHDVFSLGILLYELLTGAWPFGDPGSMLRELQRAMDDAYARAPVNAVTYEAAAARGLTAERLRRLLKGDLSAIVLKALESDASLRYRSVRDLQEDLERYLDGLPVRARDLAREDCERSLLILGPARVETAVRCAAWARYRAETGEIEPALRQVRDELPKVRKIWNRESDYLWVPLTYAAHVMLKADKFTEADRYAREALHASDIAGSPANNPWRAEATELLGSALIGERDTVPGQRLLFEAQRLYAQCGPAWSASARRLAEAIRLFSNKADHTRGPSW